MPKTYAEKKRIWNPSPSHDLFKQPGQDHNLDNRGWLTHGWQNKNGGCLRDLTTRKRETCCWPAACFQAENGNNSSKWKRGRQQCGNTKTINHIFTTLKAVSCVPDHVKIKDGKCKWIQEVSANKSISFESIFALSPSQSQSKYYCLSFRY